MVTSTSSSSYIILTGAAGFIASCVTSYLLQHRKETIVLVDSFDDEIKRNNWQRQQGDVVYIEKEDIFSWIDQHAVNISIVLHLGARTDTTEFNYAIHEKWNLLYSIKIWDGCTKYRIPLIYASSAATYGNGSQGYSDMNQDLSLLSPLNPYGISKNEFDKWAIQQMHTPPYWIGLKFFNVYGPNEYHKGRMASVIFHAYHQIKKNGFVQLFKSHRDAYKDGQQLRDFIYVKDIVNIIMWFMLMVQDKTPLSISGIYNAGTGKARTFESLAIATFKGMDMPVDIRYMDMPIDIRDSYQYFTEAIMEKLKNIGYPYSFYSLEDGVGDYVKNYLLKNTYY